MNLRGANFQFQIGDILELTPLLQYMVPFKMNPS